MPPDLSHNAVMMTLSRGVTAGCLCRWFFIAVTDLGWHMLPRLFWFHCSKVADNGCLLPGRPDSWNSMGNNVGNNMGNNIGNNTLPLIVMSGEAEVWRLVSGQRLSLHCWQSDQAGEECLGWFCCLNPLSWEVKLSVHVCDSRECHRCAGTLVFYVILQTWIISPLCPFLKRLAGLSALMIVTCWLSCTTLSGISYLLLCSVWYCDIIH